MPSESKNRGNNQNEKKSTRECPNREKNKLQLRTSGKKRQKSIKVLREKIKGKTRRKIGIIIYGPNKN